MLYIFIYHIADFSSPSLVTNHSTELIHLSAHFLPRLLLLPGTNWSLSHCVYINKSSSTV